MLGQVDDNLWRTKNEVEVFLTEVVGFLASHELTEGDAI